MEIAKWLVVLVALANFGGVIADAIVPATSRQHLWNPSWPPHAKFHNCQTMLMGILGGILSLVVIFTIPVLTPPLLLLAAGIAGNYFIAMALAPFFPGTKWTDPEFLAGEPRPFGLAAQQVLCYVICGMTVIAATISALSMWRAL